MGEADSEHMTEGNETGTALEEWRERNENNEKKREGRGK